MMLWRHHLVYSTGNLVRRRDCRDLKIQVLTLKAYKSKNFRRIFKISSPIDALLNSLKCRQVSFSCCEWFSGHLRKTWGRGPLRPPSSAGVKTWIRHWINVFLRLTFWLLQGTYRLSYVYRSSDVRLNFWAQQRLFRRTPRVDHIT